MSADGIVLLRQPVGESDRRLILLTETYGKIALIAKGARKGGSRLAGSSEPLIHGHFTWAEGKQRRFITNVRPITSYPHLRTDYVRLLAGLALAEVAGVSLPAEAPAPEIYDLIRRGLLYLDQGFPPEATLIWSLSNLMEAEGQAPDWTVCIVTDQPLRETPAAVSPRAGGFVAPDAGFFADVFLVPAEVLIALEKLKGRDEPPRKVPYPRECLVVLSSIWQGILHDPLPALQTLLQEFHPTI